MKEKKFANSNCGGGYFYKIQKNAFTLIELLAIIVILAIIAVITVPIILNIIENSKKGAATDSAYGYKDSVNKYYTEQLLNNQNLKLNDTYTVTNGTLSGGDFGDSNVTSLPIQVSGTIPTSGTLVYENNSLKTGCLVIGDYAVTFNDDGTTSVEKGTCVPSIPPTPTIPTLAEMCPGCKFIYTTSLRIGRSDMPAAADLTNDYTTLIGEGGHPYFLGLIDDGNGKIGRAFACGIGKDSNDNDVPFCLEGGINESSSTEKPIYTSNVGILNTVFPSCNASASDSYADCNGSGVYASAYAYGAVRVSGGNVDDCHVLYGGDVGCFE